jgi:hypothetical protein
MSVDDALERLKDAIRDEAFEDHCCECNDDDHINKDEANDYCSHCNDHSPDDDDCPQCSGDDKDDGLDKDEVRKLIVDLPMLTTEQIKQRLEEMIE